MSDEMLVASSALLELGTCPLVRTSYPSSFSYAEWISNQIGEGGCAAWALWHLKVFTPPGKYRVEIHRKTAFDTLNSHIGSCKWSRADQKWHPEVVKRVLNSQNFHMHKVDLKSVDLRSLFRKDGDYLVDGVLNDTFIKVHKGEEIRTWNDVDDESSPFDNESRWRHSIAVSNGRILEKEFRISARWLHLDENNNPDQNKGYMYKIFTVYRISPASDLMENVLL